MPIMITMITLTPIPNIGDLLGPTGTPPEIKVEWQGHDS